MAGGVGNRFWPVSTREKPKQFIDVLGCGKSLLQLTVEHFKGICPLENTWIVTSEEYALLVGISRETLYSWMNGITRVNDNEICYKLGSSRSDTVKKWQEECKLGRYKGAASGNVGMIFLCKAVDGMAETAPVQTQAQISQIQSSAELPRLSVASEQ